MAYICGNCFQEIEDNHCACNHCGHENGKNREEFPLALPAGSILCGQYIIGKVLGQGGFGITYLAQDYQTKKLVAIKEFFPGMMATRTGTTVMPFSGAQGENFTYGRQTFLEEAKTMAQFNGNPNIAGVQMYFEENGTAYFVMEYLDGCSFEDYIKEHGGRLSWDETAKIMLPVLDVLGLVHEQGIVHRDVSPDNIYITKDGTVKLLDFGAARHSLGNVSQSLDVVIKHGFAPKEQYFRRGRQGPYTDVYAASATIYFALTGVKPDEALERAEEDTMPPPSILGAKISSVLESVIMKGLAVEAKDRYQTAVKLRTELIRAAEKATDTRTADAAKKKLHTIPRNQILGGIAAVLAAMILIYVFTGKDKQDVATDMPDPALKQAATERPVEIRISETESEVETIPEVVVYQMMEENLDFDHVWGQDEYRRSQIKTIRFVDSKEDAPADAWDVSAGQDGSILAWVDASDNLTVAADGKITLSADASGLFGSFSSVTKIDFGDCFVTTDVTDMSSMFSGCRNLKKLDLSNFDTSKVTDMSCMFLGCDTLKNLDLPSFDTTNVTDMSRMFWGCGDLENLDLSNFNTGTVTNMSEMFYLCDSLESLDLSGFDATKVSLMNSIGMFDGCDALNNLICFDEKILLEYSIEADRWK